MRGMFVGAIAIVSLATTQQGVAEPQKGKCNPNGVAFEVIGCVHNANVDQWRKLNKNYSKYLDSMFDKCAKDNPGGGSGGFDDRTTCVSKALDAEAKRVNLK